MSKHDEPDLVKLRATLKKDSVPYFEIPSIDGHTDLLPPKGAEAYEQSAKTALALAQRLTKNGR
ncbi:hypothetical protein [Cellulomonas endometrii]|uniref:hypothetical protein n=1 Tax=Cellulomonas endometrii TaxID=3036301 RepID=UPI0024AC86B9|nr:hypothetical protein [Cellulomonas endometrii]